MAIDLKILVRSMCFISIENQFNLIPRRIIYTYGIWHSYILPVFALYSVWLAPFELAFFPSTSKSNFNISGYSVDCIFFCEVIVSIVAIIRSKPVTRIPLVKKGCYLILEIIVIIFAIIHAVYTLRTSPYVHLAFACSVVRLLRVFRIGWVNDLFARCEKNLVHIYYDVIRIARLALTNLLVVHFEGCMFYLLAAQNHTQNTWIDTIHVKHVFMGYVDSFYWSMTTVTSTGYGDLHPVNTSEKIYTIFAMLCNLAVLCYVSGNCTEIIINTNGHTRSYRQTRQSVVDYAKEKNISDELQKSLLDYIKDDFENNKFPKDILKRFPEFLKSKVNQYLFCPLLEKIYLFKDTSPKFLHDLIGEMEIVFYLPGEYIVHQNNNPSAFYIVVSGLVELKRTNNGAEGNQMSIKMRDGNVIGEFGIFRPMPEPFTLRTRTFTKLLKLNGERYNFISQKNNQEKEQVVRNFAEFMDTLHDDDSVYKDVNLEYLQGP